MKRKYSRLKISDEFSDLPVSRQRKYQLRRHKEGKCVKCGKPLCSAFYCLEHMIAAREATRKTLGSVRRNRSLSYRLEQTQKAAARSGRRRRKR